MMPVFPFRTLLMLALPVAVAAGILGFVSVKGRGFLKKQGVAWVLTALMIVAAIGIGYAKAPSNESAPRPDYPAPTAAPGAPAEAFHVWDNANVLSAQTERELSQRNTRLWNSCSVSIGVVTCDYGGDDLYDYTVKQFEAMGLGGGDMLVVLDISGDNYGLYAGRSVSRQFSDQDCSDYAYDYMEDFFAREMYDDAVLGLTEALEVWYGENYG